MSCRVEFKLSMPGRTSWNGGWSGEGKNYSIVRTLDNETASRLLATDYGHSAQKSWSHQWSDGWCAVVTARVMLTDEREEKSDGFHGYDWMIDNILKTGSPYSSEVTS